MKKITMEVISGAEGPSLYITDDGGGHRLSGPKPWGGGHTVYEFAVNPEELLRELIALCPELEKVQ